MGAFSVHSAPCACMLSAMHVPGLQTAAPVSGCGVKFAMCTSDQQANAVHNRWHALDNESAAAFGSM